MAVYWIGANGNAYYKGDDGNVVDYGHADAGSDDNQVRIYKEGYGNLSIPATRIADPNPPQSGPATNVAGIDPDAAAKADEQAYWSDQIGALQRLLGSTGTQRDQGLQRINQSYEGGVSKVREQEQTGLRDYATKREDTTKDKLTAFGGIDTKARTGYESLQRLFGLGNASVSSAARIVAPTAVSREATQQRTRANETFGRNMRDIDTKEGDFKSQIAAALADLLTQRDSASEDFLRGILGQEASLNEQLSQAVTQRDIAGGGSYRSAAASRAPFQGRVGQIQGELDSLFGKYRTPTFTPRQVQASAPDLAQYLVDPIKVAAQNANPQIDQSLLPYLAGIKDKEQGLV